MSTTQSTINGNISATRGAVPLVGRILLSAIFLYSGFGKLASPAATLVYIEAMGLPFAKIAYATAIVIEIVGGLALVAGYRTRLAAFALASFCVATAVAFHGHLGDQSQFLHFMKNLAMAGGLLQVAAFGAGNMSMDARRRG
jgi:putative oxidoreductase